MQRPAFAAIFLTILLLGSLITACGGTSAGGVGSTGPDVIGGSSEFEALPGLLAAAG